MAKEKQQAAENKKGLSLISYDMDVNQKNIKQKNATRR